MAPRQWADIELRSYPCDFCGSWRASLAFQKKGVLLERTFDIVRCGECGHVRVSPRIPDEYIADLYDDAYYSGMGFDRTVHYEAGAAADYRTSDIVRAIVNTVAQMFPAGARVHALDIGCGLGDLVLAMRDRGFESYGFDSSAYADRFMRNRSVPVITDLESCPQKYEGKFDLVTAIEVIEHTTSPTEFLRSIRRWLKPGGYAFVMTGNWAIERRVPRTPYLMPEGHIQYFTPLSLAAFFRKAGFEPQYVPVIYTWYVNRLLPKQTPRGVRAALASAVQAAFPLYGPLPLARNPG